MRVMGARRVKGCQPEARRPCSRGLSGAGP
jgi:hypothetical protein